MTKPLVFIGLGDAYFLREFLGSMGLLGIMGFGGTVFGAVVLALGKVSSAVRGTCVGRTVCGDYVGSSGNAHVYI